ncbi:hypothetical protein SAMN05216386_1533 [Nitrosospira briensis]|uniref:Uncharacterized protein n=1 Tax=Nitrosospira briensis TaxID=35799 RepID=A0A1I5ATY0_9PROT|nr:hypothetical protein SAMN05216386_1533 [Nitrosospira briensis]
MTVSAVKAESEAHKFTMHPLQINAAAAIY